MDWWIFTSFFLLTLLCAYLVSFFSSPTVPLSIKLTSILTWTLNFSLVLIVPSDIFHTLSTFGPTPTLSPHMISQSPSLQSLSFIYLLLYWSVYLLTWTIIPVLQQWQNSGDFNSTARLKRSLRVNGIFYLWMIIGAILSLGILIWFDLAGDMDLITYLKSLASAWGIFLEMVLMGYALVEIPKTHWRTGNNEQEVKYLRFKVTEGEEELNNAYEDFEDIACFVFDLKSRNETENVNNSESYVEIKQYLDTCLENIPEKVRIRIGKRYRQIIEQTNMTVYQLNTESAIELHRLTKRCLARIHRENEALETTIKKALLAEDILVAENSPTKELKTNMIKVGKFSWVWLCKVKPVLKRVLAVILGLLSLTLLIAQTQVFFGSSSTILSLLTHLHSLLSIRIFTLLILLYITYMVNYSLFRLRLSNLYGLYPHTSDGPSLMFATVNFSRVSVATIVNFFDMVKVGSVFTYIMGGSRLGVLGDWGMKGMPGVLWMMVIMHWSGGWGRVMKWMGLEEWAFRRWEGQDTVSNVLRERREKMGVEMSERGINV